MTRKQQQTEKDQLEFTNEYRKEPRALDSADEIINEYHEKGMDPRTGFEEINGPFKPE